MTRNEPNNFENHAFSKSTSSSFVLFFFLLMCTSFDKSLDMLTTQEPLKLDLLQLSDGILINVCAPSFWKKWQMQMNFHFTSSFTVPTIALFQCCLFHSIATCGWPFKCTQNSASEGVLTCEHWCWPRHHLWCMQLWRMGMNQQSKRVEPTWNVPLGLLYNLLNVVCIS